MTNLFTKPIKPGEVSALKKEMLPGYVMEAFNQCIAVGYDGHSAKVYQGEVVARILTLAGLAGDNDLTRDDVYERGYLDVEPIYRAEGWDVHYNKPGYNESYEASFLFESKKPKRK